MTAEQELDRYTGALSFTGEELHAVRIYQSDQPAPLGLTDARWHDLMNQYLRDEPLSGIGEAELRTITRVIRDLDSAIERSVLPVDVVAFRAVSGAQTVDELAELIGGDVEEGRDLDLLGFVSTSLKRDRAERFLRAPLHLMLEMHARSGSPALWVPPLGEPALAGQCELLFGSGTQVRVQGRVESADEAITVVVEVMP